MEQWNKDYISDRDIDNLIWKIVETCKESIAGEHFDYIPEEKLDRFLERIDKSLNENTKQTFSDIVSDIEYMAENARESGYDTGYDDGLKSGYDDAIEELTIDDIDESILEGYTSIPGPYGYNLVWSSAENSLLCPVTKHRFSIVQVD